jgi:hypothetical protein
MSSTSAWVIALHNIALSWGCMGETKTYSKLRLSLVFGAGDPHIVMIRPLMNYESIEVYRCGVDPKYGSCINDPILKPGFQGVVFDVRGKGLQLDHHLRWPLFLAEKTHHKPFSANSGESYQDYQVYR